MTSHPNSSPSNKSPKNLWLTVLTPVVGIVFACIIALQFVQTRMKSTTPEGANSEEFTLNTGAVLPDFTLEKLEGGSLPVSQLKYKILLVNFWATWCEACMVEMPSIIQLKEKFKDRGFEVAAIDVDENPAVVVPKVAKRLGMNFPIFIDHDSELADLFEVNAIPLTAIINRDRKILAIEPGERNWMSDAVQAKVEKWLSEGK